MKFRNANQEMGCKGFERLNLEPEALDTIAVAYAKHRGFDADVCKKLLRQYRWKKHNN